MPDDATRDFGAYLREARERQGIALRAIATSTKISVLTLEALERNDVARLPGGIFVRAFVRAYAREVGLDQEEAVRRFVARFPDAAAEEGPASYEANPAKIVLDGEPATGRLWRVIGWSLPLVAVIVYFGFGGRLGWWRDQFQSSAPRAEAQADQPPPSSATPVLTTPASMPAQTAAPATAAGPDAEVPIAAAAPADAARVPSEALPRPGDASPPAPEQASGQSGQAPAAAAGEGQFQLTLTPRGRCWVTVRSNGRIVYTGTMNVGDRQNLVLGGNVSLTLGNAGVMAVAIDGQPARALGREGEVVTALLNSRNLRTFLESR
jgi:cytoskeleton protein RodZ